MYTQIRLHIQNTYDFIILVAKCVFQMYKTIENAEMLNEQ